MLLSKEKRKLLVINSLKYSVEMGGGVDKWGLMNEQKIR